MKGWPLDVSFDLVRIETGTEAGELHNAGDLAAEVAETAFGLSDLDAAVDEFLASVRAVCGDADVHYLLRRILSAAVEEATRMGYALALTVQCSSEGWQAWALAAEAFRRAGYDAWSMAGGLEAWADEGLQLEPHDGTVAAH